MKKYSRKREAILEKLRSTDCHPTAEWIYTQLKPEFPDLSLATVYRNLSEFVKEHDAISVGTVAGQERYDADTHEHSHFFCSVCGCVIDEYECGDNTACISDLEKRGHKVERSDVIFRGVCGNCLAANG